MMRNYAPSYARQARTHNLQQLLRPGDWLDRRAIGEELNIRLAPISEAVVQLESEGGWRTPSPRSSKD